MQEYWELLTQKWNPMLNPKQVWYLFLTSQLLIKHLHHRSLSLKETVWKSIEVEESLDLSANDLMHFQMFKSKLFIFQLKKNNWTCLKTADDVLNVPFLALVQTSQTSLRSLSYIEDLWGPLFQLYGGRICALRQRLTKVS